ncbi:MAG TPA: ABC transporter substrate-binding protein, partial [Usitatibacter sp.]|nr:ABC transporter substrate-binding protein [Usitatibacter sp.]
GITDNARTYTLRVRRGIYFSDDPAFEGKPRELTAADYEFALKRLIDPKVSSPNLWLIDGRIAGVSEAAAKAKKDGRLDYDARIPGIEVVDRYTLRLHLEKPDYNLLYILAMPNVGAQAREVVERYGADIGAHPVGTGPFVLREWRRSARIVLERNPRFREEYFEAEPDPADAEAQALYAQVRGKRLPMVDRVEISILEEAQPRWLAFLNKELDWLNVPSEFINMAVPGGRQAPWLEKRGVRVMSNVEPDVVYLYFNMKDATWGGYTPDKVALRRAVSLAYNNEEEIRIIRNGGAIEAQSPLPPGVLGYDPDFNLGRTYDPPRAKALLDMYGYVDRDGDGWRDMPDGSPLVFIYTTQPAQDDRLYTELWKKCLEAVGIRVEVQVAKWPENRKKAKAGLLQSWQLSWGADYPDGENFYQLLYGPNCGTSNDGCFQLREFDALYDRAALLPPGPERTAIYQEMARIVMAYAPWKINVHRKRNQVLQPWILGWRKHPFLHEGLRYVDIDTGRRAREVK